MVGFENQSLLVRPDLTADETDFLVLEPVRQ